MRYYFPDRRKTTYGETRVITSREHEAFMEENLERYDGLWESLAEGSSPMNTNKVIYK